MTHTDFLYQLASLSGNKQTKNEMKFISIDKTKYNKTKQKSEKLTIKE